MVMYPFFVGVGRLGVRIRVRMDFFHPFFFLPKKSCAASTANSDTIEPSNKSFEIGGSQGVM